MSGSSDKPTPITEENIRDADEVMPGRRADLPPGTLPGPPPDPQQDENRDPPATEPPSSPRQQPPRGAA